MRLVSLFVKRFTVLNKVMIFALNLSLRKPLLLSVVANASSRYNLTFFFKLNLIVYQKDISLLVCKSRLYWNLLLLRQMMYYFHFWLTSHQSVVISFKFYRVDGVVFNICKRCSVFDRSSQKIFWLNSAMSKLRNHAYAYRRDLQTY